jgi:translation elongation factor EF-1beta
LAAASAASATDQGQDSDNDSIAGRTKVVTESNTSGKSNSKKGPGRRKANNEHLKKFVESEGTRARFETAEEASAANQAASGTTDKTKFMEMLTKVKKVSREERMHDLHAARAVAFGLKKKGVEVTVTSRTAERAKKIAAEVGCKSVEWAARHRMPYDGIVNATPVGMHPNVDESPYDKEHLRPYMVVFDTVYNPENTLLIKEARSAGCRTVTGVEMFVRQAAIQYRIWHGAEPPPQVMREALKRATASAKQPL